MSYPLKVIVVVAHPDEAELYTGGTTARLAGAGAAVKYLSLTNGDAGHHQVSRKPLRRRRANEAYAAARHLGVLDYEILNIHDGGLMPDAALRKALIASVRRWQADIVITFHDDCPGHTDNRMAGRAVREAAGFFANANVAPGTPALARSPICLKITDHWAIGTHRHDVVVGVDPFIEQKVKACDEHASQFYEFALYERGMRNDTIATLSWEERRAFILKNWAEFMYASPDMLAALTALNAREPETTRFAESFQLADYGRETTAVEVYDLLCTGRPIDA
jgi:LmbE family N-acetylglucosaminyl deacetylase